jgi:hypothetical protein
MSTKSVTAKNSATAKKSAVVTSKSAAAPPKKSAAAAPKKSAAMPTKADNDKAFATNNAAKNTLFKFVSAWLEDTGATESVCGRWLDQEEKFKVTVRIPRGLKAKKDPAVPKKASSAYIYFCKDKRPEVKEALIEEGNEKPSLGDVAKKLGDMWKKVGPKTKAKYEAMAAKDKARYEAEMAEYTPTEGYNAGGRKKKDPNAPKQGTSAYIYFSKDKRAEAKEALIEEGSEKPSLGEVSKRLGEMWKNVGPKTKAKYEAMAAKDKKRYEAEMDKYNPLKKDDKAKAKDKKKVEEDEEVDEEADEETEEEKAEEEEVDEEEGGEEAEEEAEEEEEEEKKPAPKGKAPQGSKKGSSGKFTIEEPSYPKVNKKGKVQQASESVQRAKKLLMKKKAK